MIDTRRPSAIKFTGTEQTKLFPSIAKSAGLNSIIKFVGPCEADKEERRGGGRRGDEKGEEAKWTMGPEEGMGDCWICRREGGRGVWLLVLVGMGMVEGLVSFGCFVFSVSLRVEIRTIYLFRKMGEGGREEREIIGFGSAN